MPDPLFGPLLEVEPVGGELVAIDPDPHRRLAEARHEDVADPGHRLQLGFDHLVGVVRELAGVETGEGHPEHGLGVGVELLDDGRLGVEGQLADRSGNLVADVLGGDVDVALGGEHHGHLRDAHDPKQQPFTHEKPRHAELRAHKSFHGLALLFFEQRSGVTDGAEQQKHHGDA